MPLVRAPLAAKSVQIFLFLRKYQIFFCTNEKAHSQAVWSLEQASEPPHIPSVFKVSQPQGEVSVAGARLWLWTQSRARSLSRNDDIFKLFLRCALEHLKIIHQKGNAPTRYRWFAHTTDHIIL